MSGFHWGNASSANSELIESFAAAVSDVDLSEHTTDIIAALGGIDQILNDYIRITRRHPEDRMLNTTQMTQISGIMNVNLGLTLLLHDLA